MRRALRLPLAALRRPLRVLLLTLVALPVLALVVLAGALVWANGEGGRGFLAHQAGALVPGLSIEGLSGPLPGRIGVARLAMADGDGAWLEVEQAEIALDLLALLRRDLRITAVNARRIALHRLPPAGDAAPPPPDPEAPLLPALPSLPVAVHLDRLALGRIELGAPVLGVAAVLSAEGAASLAGGALAARLDARRIDAPAQAGLVLDLALHRLPPAEEAPPPPPDPEAPLLPALPSLPVAVHLDRLALGRIELGAPVLGVAAVLSAEGAASLAGGALAARLEAQRIDAPAQARLVLDLAPGADRLSARLDATEPPGGVLATLLGLPDRAAEARLILDGPASGARLTLRATLGEDVSLAAEGTIRAAPDGAAGAVLDLRIAAAPLLPEDLRAAAMPADLSLDAAIDAARRVALHRLVLRVPAGEASAQGSADLAAGTIDAALRLALGESATLGPLLPPVARWDSARVELRATGAMHAPHIAAEAALEGFGSDTPQLAAALGAAPRLSLRAVLPDRIEAFSLEGAALRLSAEGAVGEALDARLRASVDDLAPLVPGLAGALSAELRASGPRADPSLALTARGERVERQGQVLEAPELVLGIETPFSAPRAQGRLAATYAGLPVALDLDGVPEGESLRIARLAARFGPASLDAEGLLDPRAATFEGNVALEATELAPFSALAGTALAGRAALRARLDLREGVQGFEATLDIPGARVAGTALGGRLRAEGSLDAFEASLEARAEDARLTTRARMATQGDARRIEIPELLLRRGTESLRLSAPARVTLGADGGLALEGIALTTGRGGTLRAEGRWGPEAADLRATLAALPVAAVAVLVAPGLAMEGVIGAELRVSGPVADRAARFRLEATGLRSADPAMRGIPAARLVVEGTAGARGAEARLDASAGQVLRATGTARLPGGFEARSPLGARLDASADLGAIAGPLLAAGAQRVAGRVTVQAEASGTIGAPRLNGRATLADGSFRDLAQGITLTNIAAALRAEGEQVSIERFEARTPGGGTISAGGSLSPMAAGLPAEITLTARNARPLRSDLVSAAFDAELRLAGRLLEQARLAGRVEVKRVDIAIPERLPPGVQRLEGVRERGRRPAQTPPLAPPTPPGAPASLPEIALDVTVEAPRAVFVRGRGIDAELGGTIGVGGSIAAPALTGGLNLRRGEISVFDRRIAFRRGAIAFDAGTLVPSLDFLAASRAREVTANVTVTGPANDPRIEFSSSPELPQDEILARLLFDRRASELSPFQLAQLAQVLAGAAGIETPGAGGIVDRIRRTLALDRLAVGEERSQDGTRSQGATLETGRYVADGVYLGIRQGTEGGAPRVGVQIDLLPRVRVEAETGGNSAGGDRVGLSFEWEY